MNTLVVFYSLEGNTKYIANALAGQLHAEILELSTAKKYPTKGVQKYLWGGKSVFMGEKPKLTNQNIDLSIYDNIVIGTPVWAGSFASPINTFIHQYNVKNKKVALFACHGGGGAKKCFQKIKEALPDNQYIGEIEFQDPLKHNKDADYQKAMEWAKNLPIDSK